MTGRRHLLIVASQCASMGPPLEDLRTVAAELCAVLTDPTVGGFAPALPDGGILRVGEVNLDNLRRDLEAAVRHAADQRAVLGLAFIGHGFVPGDDPTLYFMTTESTTGDRLSAININQLLTDAADTPGVAGVLALLDTCHAGAATPNPVALNVGQRYGETALAVLAASRATGYAYGLRFTRELTRLLRETPPAGVNGRTHIGHDLVEELRTRLGVDQHLRPQIIGDQGPLWLARQARVAPPRPATDLARTRLREAVTSWRPAYPLPEPDDETALNALHRAAMADATDSLAAQDVTSVVHSLVTAERTRRFVDAWPPAAGLSTAMRRAWQTLEPTAVPSSSEMFYDLSTLIRHIALTFPVRDRDCRRRVAQFIAALLREVDVTPSRTEITRWAREIAADLLIDDEISRAERSQRERDTVLVVVLDSPPNGEWPESISCWLYNGRTRVDARPFACAAPDQSGVERALEAALHWADSRREQGWDYTDLTRIDIAAPAPILRDWRPEAMTIYDVRLGIEHEVHSHWRERLDHSGRRLPPRLRKRLHHVARTVAAGDTRLTVDWLTADQADDTAALRVRVRNGQLSDAVAFLVRPAAEAMDLLILHAPIMLWPDQDRIESTHRAAVDKHWLQLPARCAEAYRNALIHEITEPLSEIRLVWDDEPWLWFSTHYSAGPA